MARPGAERRAKPQLDALDCAARRAFKVWIPPSIGEQVWFLCPGGNTDVAFIGGSRTAMTIQPRITQRMVVTAPRWRPVPGYDAEAGALRVTGIKTTAIEASVKITLDTPEVDTINLLTTKGLERQERAADARRYHPHWRGVYV